MLSLTTNACVECGKAFQGRIDKKFCSDQCRSTHHNRLNNTETSYMKKVNMILRKNRRILMMFRQQGNARVHRSRLNTAGFDFTHFTSLRENHDGRHFFYCYEQGYCRQENDDYFLVIKNEL